MLHNAVILYILYIHGLYQFPLQALYLYRRDTPTYYITCDDITPGTHTVLGWSDFFTFKIRLIQWCQNVVGSQFQNFMSLCCLFPWVQGNEEIFLSFHIFQVFTRNKICFLACLKAKTEEILQKIFFYYFLDQKPFWPFLGI